MRATCALPLKFYQNFYESKADKPAVSGESFVSKVATFCKYAIFRCGIYMFFIAIGLFPPSRQQNLACFVAVGTGIRRSERALRNGVVAAGDIVFAHVRMPFGPSGVWTR